VIRAMAGATLDLVSSVTLPANPLDPATPTVFPES
jgi:sirohydrochlorin cobaltochelatase